MQHRADAEQHHGMAVHAVFEAPPGREREILVQVARGRSSKEIAPDCRISSKTVGNHVNNLYQKLQLSHRGELVLYAARAGLTSPS